MHWEYIPPSHQGGEGNHHISHSNHNPKANAVEHMERKHEVKSPSGSSVVGTHVSAPIAATNATRRIQSRNTQCVCVGNEGISNAENMKKVSWT